MADNGGDDAQASPDRSRRGFNPWLAVIPAVAVATIVVVLLYGARILDPQAVHPDLTVDHVAFAGLGVLAVLFVVEVVMLAGDHPDHLEDEAEPAPGPDAPAAREDLPVEEDELSPVGADGELEALATDDRIEGRDVLEMARPPKGEVDAGVYATTYVEVDRARVLRLEEIVARRR